MSELAGDRVSLVVHGHFYQPPREDPWTGTVPEQPSAAPYHDWNERITDECYRPVSESGLLDQLSWNMGPTLLSWLKAHHADVYAGVQALVRELNAVEAAYPALHVGDSDPAAFAWLEVDDADHSTYAFERRDPGGTDVVVCLANLAGIGRHGYRVGVPTPGRWGAALSTDDERFGGRGGWRGATVESEEVPWHGRAQSVVVTLPARSVTWLVPDG